MFFYNHESFDFENFCDTVQHTRGSVNPNGGVIPPVCDNQILLPQNDVIQGISCYLPNNHNAKIVLRKFRACGTDESRVPMQPLSVNCEPRLQEAKWYAPQALSWNSGDRICRKRLSEDESISPNSKRVWKSGNPLKSRREAASEREKLRMQRVSKQLQELRNVLPSSVRNGKMSKIEILKEAISYISEMTSLVYGEDFCSRDFDKELDVAITYIDSQTTDLNHQKQNVQSQRILMR